MATSAFDREIFNFREKLVSGDFNFLQSFSDDTIRETLSRLLSGRNPSALGNNDGTRISFGASFLGDGFKARSAGGMNIVLASGLGFFKVTGDSPSNIDGISGLNDDNSLKPLVLLQEQFLTVPANLSPSLRVDIIEVRYERQREDSQSRQVLNQSTGGFESSAVNKKFSWALDGLVGSVVSPDMSVAAISYKKGTGASPPSVTSGYTKIAEVYVESGALSISSSKIVDFRKFLFPNGCGVVSTQISLPNLNSTSLLRETFKPQMVSVVAPPGVQVSCRVAAISKEYEIVITGNFDHAYADIEMIGSVGIEPPVLTFFRSLPIGARIQGIELGLVGEDKSEDYANNLISSPTIQLSPNQKSVFVRFCPFKIFLDSTVIKYTTLIPELTGGEPMVVSLTVVVV